MERPSGALGPTPAAAVEGPTVAEPAAVVGPTATMSIAKDPAAAGEGLAAGGKGPWRTRDLKE